MSFVARQDVMVATAVATAIAAGALLVGAVFDPSRPAFVDGRTGSGNGSDLLVPGAPPELVVLIETLLQKDPAARPVSAQVVADLLREIGTAFVPTAPLAPPIGTGPPAPRQLGSLASVSAHPAMTGPPQLRSLPPIDASRRQRSGAIFAGILVGAGLAAALAFLVHGRTPPPAPRPKADIASPLPSFVPPITVASGEGPPPVEDAPAPDDDPSPVSSAPPSSPWRRQRSTKVATPVPPPPSATLAIAVAAPAPAPPAQKLGLRCGPGERLTQGGKTYLPDPDLPGTPLVVASGDCQLTLRNCRIEGATSLSVNGTAKVTLDHCTVLGRVVVNSHEATLTLEGGTSITPGMLSNVPGGKVVNE